MLERQRRIHERHLKRTYLIDQMEIVRPVPGGETSLGTFAVNVQHVNTTSGVTSVDITDASTLSANVVIAYLERGADVRNGDRLVYGGIRWTASLISSASSAAPYKRVLMVRETIGTNPENITFYRRQAGTTVEVGTYTVQRVEEDPREQAGGGWHTTGVAIGGSDLNAVIAGDWFEVGMMPAQVQSKDTTAEGRVELAYGRQAVEP